MVSAEDDGENASQDEIRAADVAHGHVRGLHQDQAARKNVCHLHDGQRHGCASNPAKADFVDGFGLQVCTSRHEV